MWPAGFGDQIKPASYAASRIEHQNNDKTERLDIKKISGGATVQGPFNWAGVVDQYFAAVFLPEDSRTRPWSRCGISSMCPRIRRIPSRRRRSRWTFWESASAIFSGPTVERLYVGPKVTGCSRIRAGADSDRRAAGLARAGQLWLLRRDRPAAVPLAEVDLRHGFTTGAGPSSSRP